MRFVQGARLAVAVGAVIGLVFVNEAAAEAATAALPPTQRVSSDTFTNSAAEHHTEVEPDTYAFGSTIVGAFQVGRYSNGGADDIGYATSTDGGQTWHHGLLSGITKIAGSGTFDRVSDPAVAYDAKTQTWLISGLAITNTTGVAIVVSHSTDGITWSTSPVIAYRVPTTAFLDKDWITCDDTAASPHYGNCYAEADRADLGDQVNMVRSTDGGATWSAPQAPNVPLGLGGQPLVQPNGTVVVPYLTNSGAIEAFRSTDGGSSWTTGTQVAQTTTFTDPGMRSSPLPSAQVDGSGTVYVAWEDCRFRVSCSSNDIVYATSVDGVSWGAVRRVPIDAVSSTQDHFDPGIGLDRTTSGASARVGVYYYDMPKAACTASTCKIREGFIESTNGGSTWGTAENVSPAMTENELAQAGGAFLGDYQGCAFAGGKAFSVYAVGKPLSSSGLRNEGMWVATGGL